MWRRRRNLDGSGVYAVIGEALIVIIDYRQIVLGVVGTV